jgi:hypothetical protein
MLNVSHGGKGDKRRPENHDSYRNNYDHIFGKKEKNSVFHESPETANKNNIIKVQFSKKHNNENKHI